MWLAVLFVWGSLLPLAASEGCPETSEDASSMVRLKPLGHCRDGENTCPYRITLPPLTIHLPKPFRELEKMARELQSLTQMVNQLKADCQVCKERQRMEWSLRMTDGGEDRERIQASRGSVNTKERQQDLSKRMNLHQGSTQKTEEEGTMLISSGTKHVNTTGMEKQWWNTNRERNLNPSSTRYRDETSGGQKGSSSTHMERKTDSMSKVRELHSLTAGERGKELDSPRAELIESSLSGNQNVKQPLQVSRGTVNTREDLPKREKVVQGTAKKTELDTILSSSGTKKVNPTGTEKQRWNTSQVRNLNPNSTRHRDETSGRPKGSSLARMESRTESMSKVSTRENGGGLQSKLIESSLGNQDDEQPTQAPSGTVNTREKQQDTPKRLMEVQGTVQETEEQATMLIRSETKQVSPTDMEKLRWSTIQERNPNQSGTERKKVTSGGLKGSNPAPMERRTESMSKVKEPLSFSTEENGKEFQSPRTKLTESLLQSQDEEQPTQAPSGTVSTRERQQDRMTVVQSTVHEIEEEDTMLIGSETKQESPTDMEKQTWSTTGEGNLNPSSTGHSEEASEGLKASTPAHMERATESSKVTEPESLSTVKRGKELHSPRVKQIESFLPRNEHEEQPTQASSGTVNTRETQQDVSKRLKVYQGTTQKTEEDDTTHINSGPKEVNPADTEKQRWSTSQDRKFNISSTRHRDESSGRPKESNPAHMENKTESISEEREAHSFTAEERGKELQSPRAKQTNSFVSENQDEDQPIQVSSSTVNTRGRQQDIPKRVKVFQRKTEEDTMLISSGTKDVNPTDIEKQRSNNSQVRDLNLNSTQNRDENSGGPKESNPVHMERRTEALGKARESHSLTAEEKQIELHSPMAKQIESSLPGNQDEQSNQERYEKPRQTSTGNAGTGMSPSGTLTAQGKIKNNPEISGVTMVSVDTAETKQLNPPNKDSLIKRFFGHPRQTDTDIKEIKLNSNPEDRFENTGTITKRISHVGDRKVKNVSRGSGFTPIRTRTIERRPHKADSKEGTTPDSRWITPDPYREDQDASLLDIIKDTPKTIDSKKVFEDRQPETGTKAQNNRVKLNVTDVTKTVLDQQGEEKEEVSDIGVKESRPFILDKTGDSTVTKESHANIILSQMSENKDKRERGNQVSQTEPKPFNQSKDSDSETELDANPVNTLETVSESGKLRSSISDTGDATLDVRVSHPWTQDRHSEKPFNPRRKAENDTRVDSSPVTPVGIINRPGKIRSSISDRADATTDLSNPNLQIQDGSSEKTVNPSTQKVTDTRMDSAPANTVETVTGLEKSSSALPVKADAPVDVSGTTPQHLHKNDDLSKDQLKPHLNTTKPSSEGIKAKTKTKDMLSNNKTTSLRTGPVKQTATATEDKSPVSLSRPRTHAVGSKVRSRPSGLMSMSQVVDPHPVDSTKVKEGVRELNETNLRLVKNITTTRTRAILAKNPTQRRPHILQRMPGNESMETPMKAYSSGQVKNTSGLTEHMVDPRRRHVHSKTRPPSSNSKKEFKSSVVTQSVSPTVATYTTVDHASTEKSQTAPTVEALNSPDNHQIQTTSQNTKTKLFHVAEPENPEGKRELDPITDSVREHSAETVMNQNIVSHDGNDNMSGPHSHQAVVEKTRSTDRGTNPFRAISGDSKQENNKKFLRAGSVHSSRGKILPTAEEMSTERNELNYPTSTATKYTIKTSIKDQQSQMTQPTTPVVTTPHFMRQDHIEKAKTTSIVNVSDTHIHHRLRYSSQEVESKRLIGTRSDSDSRNKKQDLILQSTGKVQRGFSTVTASYPKSADSARDPKSVVKDRVKSTAGPKRSTSSTYSTPHTYHENRKSPVITVASMEGNNGEIYPVAVDRAVDSKSMTERKRVNLQKTKAEKTIKQNSARLLTNNMEDKDDLENQLLSTCHGQCDPSPTLQPVLDIWRPSENGGEKTPQDCSDLLKKKLKNGFYSVTPAGSKNITFHVFCDMEASGGGWTLIQNRFDGSISFNRSWDNYKRGFGNLSGEFWLGNDKIHWLTSAKAMVLRIELEDVDGVKEYAQYNRFHVANESQHYRLTIGGYSGTAGNALQFNKNFNHNQKNFTTPDRDNDRYPSGNCGAYYSSGWWFDACMAANLNGKYYQTRYKGVRNGIFWGTWHNISTEYYPTNDRQAFKTVRMMVRPRMATVRD
ncbi:uncharacterized protein fgl2b [Pygocentrus nattereri]|uniref:Fibrinogen C-terminal domain-containing protein n=1 Tax=Pygocentrus nattereri TaxID=42514 RepID=A0A3B4CIZ0_PYGNA|nr:uncharacterized protein fgl2b [Pygocentrus nattereri]